MCIVSNRGSQAVVQPKSTFRDAPPIVTGSQTGVANPKDTEKATEELKIERQKEEGTYLDPNLSRLEEALNPGSGRSNRRGFSRRSSIGSRRGSSSSRGRRS